LKLYLNGYKKRLPLQGALEMEKQKQVRITARDQNQLANALKRFRTLSGMTQWELSQKSGVRQHRISLIESGRQNPTMPTIFNLLAALNLEMELKPRPAKPHGKKED